MNKQTTIIKIRLNKKDKEQATKILNKLGITMNELINVTIKQVIIKKGIPFEITIPKKSDNLGKYFTKEELDNT